MVLYLYGRISALGLDLSFGSCSGGTLVSTTKMAQWRVYYIVPVCLLVGAMAVAAAAGIRHSSYGWRTREGVNCAMG